VQAEQIAQWRRRRPAREAVVADVQHAAGLEVATGELDDQLLIVAADPGPDAMQADAVERRQIIAGQQLLEAVVIQTGLAVPVVRQCDGMRGLRWREVGADVVARVGGGVDVDRDTLAKAQLAVVAAAAFQGGKTAQQQTKTLEHRVDFPAVRIGVTLVGEIPFVPGIAHGCILQFASESRSYKGWQCAPQAEKHVSESYDCRGV